MSKSFYAIGDRGRFTVTHTSGSVSQNDECMKTYTQKIQSSVGNPYWLLGSTDGDIGGAFSQENAWSVYDNPVNFPASPSWPYTIKGQMRPQYAGNSWPLISAPSNGKQDADGTHAIAKVIPTNPNAGLSTFIGELRGEGLPRLIGSGLFKSRLRDFRELGSEYLNVKFGWEPFARDLRSFAQSVTESEKILSDFRKQSGQRVKRSYSYPVDVAVLYTDQGSLTPLPALASNHYTGAQSKQYYITTTTTKRWFNGCFTFYVPIGNSAMDNIKRHAQEARKLLGLELTPETVWNLTPWSWAVDWIGNMGDITHNVSRFMNDSLVMNYGYMMTHIHVRRVVVNTGVSFKNGGITGPLTLTLEHELKLRRPATPYGFGLNPLLFTDQQKAIIGALGISSVPSRRR